MTRTTMAALALLGTLALGLDPAVAEGDGPWKVATSSFGTVVYNERRDIAFTAPDEKAGEEMAEALNDAEKHWPKENEGDGKGGGEKGKG